jgi:CheY-like chemotaxis protein
VGPRPRILLVDDNLSLRRLVVRLLEEDGYAALSVGLPADAATLLIDIAFDLVLTDTVSSGLDGALTRSTDVLLAAGATPVALFTAHSVQYDDALASGFSDLILKPFDIDEFGEHVRSLLPATV